MPAVATLAISVKAQTAQFNREMRRSSQRVKNFARTTERAASPLRRIGAMLFNPYTAAVTGIALLGVGLRRTLGAAEDFNRAMNQSLAIMGDVSKVMRQDMTAAAVEVARVTQFSASEAAKAYFFLASAGLSTAQSLKALPIVGKFAQAGMFDLALATDLLTDAQSALGLTVDDTTRNMENMTRVSDVLVQANKMANATVQQFSQALTTKAGAALKVLGKDMEEGIAVLAAFADQGLKGAEGGTALQIVLRELTSKAILNERAFRRQNIAVFNSAGKMGNMADVIGDVERALDGMSNKLAKSTLMQLGFTNKSVIYIQTLIGMSEKMRAYEKRARAAGQATQEVAEKQLTPLQEGMAEVGAGFAGAAQQTQWFNTVLGEGAKTLGMFLGAGKKVKASLTDLYVDVFGAGKAIDAAALAKASVDAMLAVRKENQKAADDREKAIARQQQNADEAASRQRKAIREQRTALSREARDIIQQLGGSLAAVGDKPGEAAIRQIEALVSKGLDPKFAAVAKTMAEDLQKAFNVARVEDMTKALNLQLEALERTSKEFALLEATRKGATGAQLMEIAALHDAIEAAQERKAAEREITSEIERRQRLIERGGGMARQVSPSRFAITGSGFGREQLVRDPQLDRTNRTLERIETNTQDNVARFN